MSRLFAAGLIFLIIITNIKLGTLNSYQIAGLTLFLALMTDLIDGPIARKLNAATKFGYYFDHIVDGFLIIPIFYVVVTHLFRPLVMTILAFQCIVAIISLNRIFLSVRVKWPNDWGKVSYGFFGASACVVLFMYQTPYWMYFSVIANIVLGISVILRFISFLVYSKEVRRNEKNIQKAIKKTDGS
ncbi:CDP-alcohol phosphatidyltransferase family protein [bacterium]|nr:CDP-alcohol phosphatidyltransferase family protein [bacterium]